MKKDETENMTVFDNLTILEHNQRISDLEEDNKKLNAEVSILKNTIEIYGTNITEALKTYNKLVDRYDRREGWDIKEDSYKPRELIKDFKINKKSVKI